MAEFYTDMYTKAFASDLMELPSSKATLLPYITNKGSFTGEEAYFNQIDSMTANTGLTRYEEHSFTEADFSRRRVTPEAHWLATRLAKVDQVKSLVDPRSEIAMQVKHALSRKMAQQAVTAAFGTAYTGKAGGTSESFNSSDIVAVDVGSTGTTGLNADKIVYAIEKMQNQGIDPTDPMYEPTLVISPQLARDAKLDSTLSNRDYMTTQILSGIGLPQGFMGIKNVIVDPICPYANNATTGINASWTAKGFAQDDTGAADIRMAFIVSKGALAYGMWEEPIVRVDELQKNHYDWQLYSRVQIGVTRMLAQGGIIGILCNQSV